MKVSFAKGQTSGINVSKVENPVIKEDIAVNVVPEPSTQIVPQERQLPSLPVEDNGMEGEVNMRDIRPPRLNLTHNTGDLGDEFGGGYFVFDKAFALTDDKHTSIRFTVLRFKKFYQEVLPYGGDNIPQRFDTAAEVEAAGGSIHYGDDGYFSDAADVLIALEAPEHLGEGEQMYFPFEHGGKNYAMGIYTINKSAFTALGKKIITDSRMLLRSGLWTAGYEMSAEKKKGPKGFYYVPKVKSTGLHTPEAIAFFREMAGK